MGNNGFETKYNNQATYPEDRDIFLGSGNISSEKKELQSDETDSESTVDNEQPANKGSRIITIAAKVMSVLFTPMLIPTYVVLLTFWGTYLQVVELKARLLVLGAVFAFTCLLPLIVIAFLKTIHVAKSFDLTERHERPIPYAVATVCYVGLWLYLRALHAEPWVANFFIATAAAAVVNFVVNFRWKISGHATGMGGLVAFTFFMCWRHVTFSGSPVWFLLSVVAAGLVCSSRLVLERHTPMQILAGLATGIGSVSIAEMLA